MLWWCEAGDVLDSTGHCAWVFLPFCQAHNRVRADLSQQIRRLVLTISGFEDAFLRQGVTLQNYLLPVRHVLGSLCTCLVLGPSISMYGSQNSRGNDADARGWQRGHVLMLTILTCGCVMLCTPDE